MVNTENVTSQELDSFVNATGALNVVNTTFAAYLRKAVAVNDTEPCAHHSTVKGQPKLLCKALRQQDLTKTLLAVRYPVVFCHSMSDMLVSFGNVPNISLNPDYLSAYVVPGTHAVAEVICLARYFLYFFKGMDGYQIPQNAVCESSYPTPVPSPPLPACAPKKSPCTSSSECCNSSKFGCFGTHPSSRQCLPCAKKNMKCSNDTDCCKGGTKLNCQKRKCVRCTKSGRTCQSHKQCCSNQCKADKAHGNRHCK